jgi:hypothetical protein
MVSCETAKDRPAPAYTRDSARGHGDQGTGTNKSLCRRMWRTLKAWMLVPEWSLREPFYAMRFRKGFRYGSGL